MRKFTQLYNMISREWTGIASGMDRVKSRIHACLPVLTVLIMLMVGVGNAWGNKVSSANSSSDISGGKIVMTGAGNHATFTFAVTGKTITHNGINYSGMEVGKNSTVKAYFSWTKEADVSIKVTKISLDVTGYINHTQTVFGGTTTDVGSEWGVMKTISASNNSGLSNNVELQLKNTSSGLFGGSRSFYIKNISITYTITPNAPSVTVNPKTASVNVTLNTNSPTNLDVASKFSSSDHYNSRSYTVSTNPGSAGHMNGSNFYATAAGTYVVKAKYNASTGCHEDSEFGEGLTVTVNRLDPTLTYTNGTVDVSVNTSTDKISLNLNDLKTAYTGNGIVSYAFTDGKDHSNGVISDSTFYATEAKTYYITATSTQTGQYAGKTANFTVKVNKRTPTIVFAMTGEDDHIYSGNTLDNMAKVQYNSTDLSLEEVDFDYSLDNPSWFLINKDNKKQILVSTDYTQATKETLYVTTKETSYYKSVTASHEYDLEVKKTPEFYLNGVLLDKTKTTDLNLEIDSTATFTFDKITSGFQYPTTPSHFTYNNETGVLTATVAGDEPFFFNEPGDAETFQHQCNLHLYVTKHTTELSTILKDNDVWMVDDSLAESSLYTLTKGDANVPVVISSDKPGVIAKENGKWVAKGKGSAVLTIAQVNSDKWTGDTITRTINVNRYTPTFDWSGLPDTLNFNTTFVNPVRSTSDGAITYKSNKSAVTVTNDSTTLHTAETADNTVTITAIQKPTYKYEGKTATKTVKVLKLRNHVKVEVKSNETYLAVRKNTEGDVAWVGGSDNAIRLGGSSTGITSSPAWNWNDKYIDVKFEGIPKTISFTTGVTSSSATQGKVFEGANGFWYMIEYPEGESEQTIWTDAENNNPGDISRDLKPNTNKVRICYTGNFAGYVKNLTITERTELTASTNDIAFGDDFRVGDAATERSFTIDWYNLNPLTVTSNNPKFVVLTPTIASKKDSFATKVPIRIQYLHTEEGTNDSGTITVTNNIDGKSVSVTVHGKTLKRTQKISWLEDYDSESPVMNVTDTLKLAKATSGLPVTYVSSDPSIAEVVNDTLVYAKSLGNVTITAKQSGNGSWYAAVDSVKEFRVTQKIRQVIVWSQDLTRLNPDNEVKRDTLRARVMVLNQESNKLEEVPAQTAKIQYTITGQTGVVTLSDSIITYTETEGSTAIRAYVPEDETYAAVSLTKPVRVRRPANGCDDPLIPTNLQTPYEIFTGTLDETHVDITLDRSQGEPEAMIFYHRGEYWWLLNRWSFYEGELQVQQYVNNQWSNVLYSVTPAIGASNESARIPLDRRATMIRITRPENGQGYHYIDSIAIFRKKYIESATTEVAFGSVDRGDEHNMDITVNYSNCKSDLSVTHTNAQIALKRNNSTLTSVGIDCGEISNFTFSLTFNPDVPGEMKDTIVIADAVGGVQLAIPVSANIKKSSQTITWTQDTAIVTTTNLTLAASATSGESVTYGVVSGSDVATVDKNTGVVTIIKGGTVTFRATQAGTGYYNSITKDRTFTIAKVTPSISTVPTASAVTLPATLTASNLSGGTASVEGTFAWTNPSTALVAEDIAYEVTFTPKNTNWYTTATCMVTPLVSKATQTIDWSFNATEMYGNADYTFDATASSGLTVTYSSSKNEVASVNDQNKLVLHKAGESVTITATQAGNEIYLPASEERTFTVLRWTPSIVEYPVGGTMYVGRILSDASLDGGRAEVGGQKVEGSFVWENANSATIDVPGPATHNVIFVPQNGNFYNEVNCGPIALTVLKYLPVITSNTLTADGIEFPQTLENSNLHGSVSTMDYVHIPNVAVTGHVEWKTPTTILRPGMQTATAWFVPDNGDWYENVEIPVSVQVTGGYVFNGDNTDWTEENNWAGNLVPTGIDDPVLINEDVDIMTSVTVGSLTIKEGVDVVIKDGGVLTIGNDDSETRTAYGNLHVENGGQLILGAGELKVNDFTLEAKLGNISENTPAKSGQVTGVEALTITGDAYFDLALDPSGLCSAGWYDFTVPFPVDVMTGVSRFNRNTGEEYAIYNEVNYAIMDFSESRRVESGYGWKKFRGIMQPGQCYSITIDSYDNVYRFKKTSTGSFNTQMSEMLAYTEGESLVRGWNGLGNGTMKHIDLSAENIEKVQIYNHSTNSYTPAEMGDFTYVVGSAYFVQAPTANSTIEYSTGTKGAEYFRAPQRYVNSERSEFKLTLAQEGASNAEDLLYVGATEESVNEYEIGRDLTKFGTPTESKVAQVWANAYDMKLCDIDMQLVNNRARCSLGIYAPQAGSYLLNVAAAPEDAQLYLTYNDHVIWNLSMAPYTFDITKGTTEGYGLYIVASQQTTTDLENAEMLNGENGARKVMIDNVLYIVTPDGAMYDVTGKSVR